MKILSAIIVPVAAQGIPTASILTFLCAWGLYAIPLIFCTKMTKRLTVMIAEPAGKTFIDYGLVMSSNAAVIAAPCRLVIFLNRYLIAGLLAGSGK
jgi:multiple sugar transport system permease protein